MLNGGIREKQTKKTNQLGLGTIANCNVIIANNRWTALPSLQQEKDGVGEKKDTG